VSAWRIKVKFAAAMGDVLQMDSCASVGHARRVASRERPAAAMVYVPRNYLAFVACAASAAPKDPPAARMKHAPRRDSLVVQVCAKSVASMELPAVATRGFFSVPETQR